MCHRGDQDDVDTCRVALICVRHIVYIHVIYSRLVPHVDVLGLLCKRVDRDQHPLHRVDRIRVHSTKCDRPCARVRYQLEVPIYHNNHVSNLLTALIDDYQFGTLSYFAFSGVAVTLDEDG